jgi:hypothetical protein
MSKFGVSSAPEFALGFRRWKDLLLTSLCDVCECVSEVLVLESEPVDPRLSVAGVSWSVCEFRTLVRQPLPC